MHAQPGLDSRLALAPVACVPKGQISGLPTTSVGNRFQLWALGCFCTERHLAKRLMNNSFYPFSRQQPTVFVLEYYLDTLWKGALLFAVCLGLISSGLVSTVQDQETWGFPAYGVGVGLWLMVSSLPRRRLVLNHARGMYQFSIQGRTVYQGPLHLIYVRLALSSDAYGRCFFQLVLCGHKLEPLVLVQLSERYEQMEFLGRHIARKLNINYFDYLTVSYRHVVRHWPLGATSSPGIVHRKDHTYGKASHSLSDLDAEARAAAATSRRAPRVGGLRETPEREVGPPEWSPRERTTVGHMCPRSDASFVKRVGGQEGEPDVMRAANSERAATKKVIRLVAGRRGELQLRGRAQKYR
ncbi:transmembrane protein 249 [Orycteropus afer afer]|uniref:Transmembrane protein 249 n=1 Tax=Orycteropus afer afer TaxID=1230840 RepID=A0A8B7B312_ORYAF|nr:transmembrane protein 249 [Orycteropus afer afer]